MSPAEINGTFGSVLVCLSCSIDRIIYRDSSAKTLLPESDVVIDIFLKDGADGE
jgi:hypothetical protein